MPVRIHTTSPDFITVLRSRYAGFLSASPHPEIDFDVELEPLGFNGEDKPVDLHLHHGSWSLQRGDFIAEWEPASHHGQIRQTLNPHSLDCVLRIVHSLVLAREGGFLGGGLNLGADAGAAVGQGEHAGGGVPGHHGGG